MMPDVGRVGEDQVRRDWAAAACDDAGKVAPHHVKASLRPQVTGGSTKAGIEFDANGFLDLLGAENGERGTVEAASADGGVGKVDRAEAAAHNGPNVAGNLNRESVGSRELPEAVPLGGRLPCIERRLHGLSSSFDRALVSRDHRSHSPSFARSSIRCSHTQSIPSAAS